jgi:hypothetical protein
VCKGKHKILCLHEGAAWSGGLVRDFFLLHSVQTTSGAHHPPMQWLPGDLSPGVKQLEREADYLPTSSAKDNKGIYVYVCIYRMNTVE